MKIDEEMADKWTKWQQKELKRFESTEHIQKLLSSAQMPLVEKLLGQRKLPVSTFRRMSGEVITDPPRPIALFLYQTISHALEGPNTSEKMTGSERRRLAARIRDSANSLSDALQPLFKDMRSIPFQFQSLLDGLALDLSADHFQKLREDGVEIAVDEEAENRSRFAIYAVLMHKPGDYLDTLIEAADWWADSKTILKKPNDPNALRLYFIRKLTDAFFREFKTPMRAATLAITSVYFSCEDIDEAALSRLAPVSVRPEKPTPVEIPKESYERIKALMAEHNIDLDWTLGLTESNEEK